MESADGVGQPLLKVTLCYAAGLLAAEWCRLPWAPVLALALAVGVTAIIWARRRELLLAVLLVLTGWTNLLLHTAIISPDDLRTVAGNQPIEVVTRGRLLETPRQRVYDRGDEMAWRTLARVEIESLRPVDGPWRRARGVVAATTPEILPGTWSAGQRVELRGVLMVPSEPIAEELFNYRRYLERLGIHYQLRVESADDWKALRPVLGASVAARFGAWAKRNLALGLPEEDEPLRLLWAMTLGWQTALTGEVSEPFMRSGTMHVFAISGLHIALIAGILVAVLRVLRMPRAWCGLVVIPMLWFYVWVTGWQASAIRSTIMMSVIIGGWALRRPSDLLNSLSAAALIILLWDPQQLFQASFQLSFSVVFSLALVTPLLRQWWERLFQSEPFLPDELRPRWQRLLAPATRYASGAVVTSGAAWLGSIPLVACYFHYFTPVSLLANLLIVPLSGAALASAMGSLCCGGWWPAVAELFNHSAWFFMSAMIRVSEWAAHLPGACFNVASPTPLGFACYYAILICVLSGWLRTPGTRRWVMAGLTILAAAWGIDRIVASQQTHLTVLPLSGGHAVYFDAPGHRDDLLVDCGSESAVEFVTKPFLRALGVNRLPGLLLTHGDARQVGGAVALNDGFRVAKVLCSPLPFRSGAYRHGLEQLGREGIPKQTVARGNHVGPWSLAHPDASDRVTLADDGCLVLRGTIGNVRILLLSDLGRTGQRILAEREEDLTADIVVAGLPYGSEPLATGLLEMIHPQLVVVADSEYPATRRASRTLKERLASTGFKVIYTRLAGAVTIRTCGSGCEVIGARADGGPPLILRNALSPPDSGAVEQSAGTVQRRSALATR